MAPFFSSSHCCVVLHLPTILLDLCYVCKNLFFALGDQMIRYVCKDLLFDLGVNIPVTGILTLVQTCHWLASNKNILSGNGEGRCGFLCVCFLRTLEMPFLEGTTP